MVPYGTIWYHMVPYGTIWSPPPGWGETLLGRGKFFGFLTFEKKGHIFISKNQKKHQNSSNIKEFWPFDLWKRIPMKFRSFWSKNHWKLTILSRVMILFGFYVEIWYHMVPYGTIDHNGTVPKGIIWYHMAPYSTLWTVWYHKVPYGTTWYH